MPNVAVFSEECTIEACQEGFELREGQCVTHRLALALQRTLDTCLTAPKLNRNFDTGCQLLANGFPIGGRCNPFTRSGNCVDNFGVPASYPPISGDRVSTKNLVVGLDVACSHNLVASPKIVIAPRFTLAFMVVRICLLYLVIILILVSKQTQTGSQTLSLVVHG